MIIRFAFVALMAVASVSLPSRVAAAPLAGEAEMLGGIRTRLEAARQSATDPRQQMALRNAATEIEAAARAVAQGDEKAAIGHKRKAMQWVTWAAEACADPRELAVQIGERLVAEGGMTREDLGKVSDLFDALDAAKKRRGKSGNPFYDGMAIGEIVNAIIRLIGEGFDGWHPKRAINWYADAAASCEDVQAMIDRLLDYEQKNRDATGVPSMGPAAAAEIRRLLDELYAMKRRGATPGELADMADRIKTVMTEEGRRVARARHEADSAAGGTPAGSPAPPEQSHPAQTPRPAGVPAARPGGEPPRTAAGPAPVTTVTFSALDGETEVNRQFVGHLETVTFVAADGHEIDRNTVSPDLRQRPDGYLVRLGKPERVAAIVLTGTTGVVRLLSGGGGSAVSSTPGLSPLDGALEVRNGVVNETLSATTSAGPVRFERSIGELAVSFDARPVQVVATRPGQVAVSGRGVPAAGAERQVTITAAGSMLAAGSVPSWGYDIALPQVTKTGAWIPVTVQLFGLAPDERVSLRFQPLPGQEIEPLEATVSAGQALMPTPVARLRTNRPGAQALSVVVQREAR